MASGGRNDVQMTPQMAQRRNVLEEILPDSLKNLIEEKQQAMNYHYLKNTQPDTYAHMNKRYKERRTEYGKLSREFQSLGGNLDAVQNVHGVPGRYAMIRPKKHLELLDSRKQELIVYETNRKKLRDDMLIGFSSGGERYKQTAKYNEMYKKHESMLNEYEQMYKEYCDLGGKPIEGYKPSSQQEHSLLPVPRDIYANKSYTLNFLDLKLTTDMKKINKFNELLAKYPTLIDENSVLYKALDYHLAKLKASHREATDEIHRIQQRDPNAIEDADIYIRKIKEKDKTVYDRFNKMITDSKCAKKEHGTDLHQALLKYRDSLHSIVYEETYASDSVTKHIQAAQGSTTLETVPASTKKQHISHVHTATTEETQSATRAIQSNQADQTLNNDRTKLRNMKQSLDKTRLAMYAAEKDIREHHHCFKDTGDEYQRKLGIYTDIGFEYERKNDEILALQNKIRQEDATVARHQQQQQSQQHQTGELQNKPFAQNAARYNQKPQYTQSKQGARTSETQSRNAKATPYDRPQQTALDEHQHSSTTSQGARPKQRQHPASQASMQEHNVTHHKQYTDTKISNIPQSDQRDIYSVAVSHKQPTISPQQPDPSSSALYKYSSGHPSPPHSSFPDYSQQMMQYPLPGNWQLGHQQMMPQPHASQYVRPEYQQLAPEQYASQYAMPEYQQLVPEQYASQYAMPEHQQLVPERYASQNAMPEYQQMMPDQYASQYEHAPSHMQHRQRYQFNQGSMPANTIGDQTHNLGQIPIDRASIQAPVQFPQQPISHSMQYAMPELTTQAHFLGITPSQMRSPGRTTPSPPKSPLKLCEAMTQAFSSKR